MNKAELFGWIKERKSFLCVGLDPDPSRIPAHLGKGPAAVYRFNQAIIDATRDLCVAYKPNIAFYEARGVDGLRELQMTMEYLQSEHPDIFTICDAKRADIGSTSEAYASAIFDNLGFDSITLHPYLGKDALLPFLEREDKGCIILCRTSNAGAIEFQDLEVEGKRLWQVIAEKVANDWNENDNCMLVVGATYPNEMKIVRDNVGDMTLLVPGIGVQGGNVQQTVTSGLNSQGKGLIINSARGIIFSENPAQSARELRDGINAYR